MQIQSVNNHSFFKRNTNNLSKQTPSDIKEQQITDMKQLYPKNNVSFGSSKKLLQIDKDNQTATLKASFECDNTGFNLKEAKLDFKTGTLTQKGNMILYGKHANCKRQNLVKVTQIPKEIIGKYTIYDFSTEKMTKLLNTKPYPNSFFTLKELPYNTKFFVENSEGGLVPANFGEYNKFASGSDTGKIDLDDEGCFKGIRIDKAIPYEFVTVPVLTAYFNDDGVIEETIEKEDRDISSRKYEKYENIYLPETMQGIPKNAEIKKEGINYQIEYYPTGTPKKCTAEGWDAGKGGDIEYETHYNKKGEPVYIRCRPETLCFKNELILMASEMIRRNPENHFERAFGVKRQMV